MLNEKIVIAPAPILRALRDNQLPLKSLNEPEVLLSILSTRDVIFYYVLNVMLCDPDFRKSLAGLANPLTASLSGLTYYTNGVMNVFTQPEWVSFADDNHADIQAELSTMCLRTCYEYATGEPYDVEAHQTGAALEYDFKSTVLNGEIVCVMVVPRVDVAVTDSMLSKRLFRQVIYSMNTLTTRAVEYKSLYQGLCTHVVNEAIAQR